MVVKQEYSGWTNYPTWNMALWMDNDQGLQEMVLEQAAASKDKYELADWLKNFWEEQADEQGLTTNSGPFVDIFGWALEQVNWDEIAEKYLDQLEEG